MSFEEWDFDLSKTIHQNKGSNKSSRRAIAQFSLTYAHYVVAFTKWTLTF